MPVTRADVIWGHRFILGREPESGDVIRSFLALDDREALRRALLSSAEFREKAPLCMEGADGTAIDQDRAVLIFLHIPKCAGTSLHAVLQKSHAESMCPERHNGLGNWQAGVLARYSYFSGHFDVSSLALIPSRKQKVVTMLRRPRERLLSAYRFLRCHTDAAVRGQRDNMGLVDLARSHDPVAFFTHPGLVRHASINNGMTRILSGALPQKRWEAFHAGRVPAPALTDTAPDKAVEAAINMLRGMTAFGVQEHMEPSTRHILDTLGLPFPRHMPRRQVFETIVQHNPALEDVAPVEMTPALSDALAPHVALDDQLYEAGLEMLGERGVRF